MAGGGMTLLIILFLLGIWRTGHQFLGKIEAFFNLEPPAPQVDVSNLILNQVRGVSELTGAVFVMEAVVPTAQERKLGSFVFRTQLLYIAQGEVRAGVDLTQLKSENVTVNNGKIKIKLPPAKILDSKIDVSRSRVYDYNRGFLNLGPDVAPQLQILAQQETLKKIVTTACDKGILNQANERAKLAITQLLNTVGYQQLEVISTPLSLEECKPTKVTGD
jgi:hypothetical protein